MNSAKLIPWPVFIRPFTLKSIPQLLSFLSPYPHIVSNIDITHLSLASIWLTLTCLPTVLRNSIKPSLSSHSAFVTSSRFPSCSVVYPRSSAYVCPVSKNFSICCQRLSNEFWRWRDSIESRSVVRPEGSPTEAVALPTWLFGVSMV